MSEPSYYAQRGEDKKLVELLSQALVEADPANAHKMGYKGFYIDVGAWHPETDSVTKHFYDLGWRGVNIEPVPELIQAFQQQRPRDINLMLAIDDSSATFQTFYYVPGTGLSTFDRELARKAKNLSGVEAREIKVPTMRLAEVCRTYLLPGQEIDFLKVDVEGWETQVLQSHDWRRFPAMIVVVEATVPGTETPSHQPWEPFLLSQGYKFIEFDGLNRYYRNVRSAPSRN